VATDHAWAEELKPLEGATARRTLYLDRTKRRLLVEKASAEAKPLFRTLNMLPMRPGEVAALRVEYLKASQRALEITGKTEPRVIPLTDEALEHFRTCARGKLPGAWLVSRADGSQWKKEAWRDEIKAAVRKARLPRATVAYTLRHSVITDLVTGGLDIFTVAKLAGTSVVMVEKHYGHLQREHARSALEKLALA
jgi:site-specific recombinase XerD